MKRFISITIVLLAFCSSSFARIMLQADMGTIGNLSLAKRDFETADVISREFDFTEFGFFDVGTYWEFKSDTPKKIHYFIGSTIGLAYDVGGYIGLSNGINYTISTSDKVTAELSFTLDAGICTDIFTSMGLYGKFGCNVLFMAPNRKGLYGGAGITSFSAMSAGIGADTCDYYDYVGLTLMAGVRI